MTVVVCIHKALPYIDSLCMEPVALVLHMVIQLNQLIVSKSVRGLAQTQK